MSYLAPRKKNSIKKTVYGLILPAVFLVLIQLIFPSFIPNITYRLFSPFWKIDFQSEKDLYQEVLQKDFYESAILQENLALKEMLGRKNVSDFDQRILAVVLERPPYSPYDSFMIDVGSDLGIKEGSKVYVDGGLHIGNVDKVYGNHSKVILFSSPTNSIDVDIYIDQEKYEEIIKSGQYSNNSTTSATTTATTTTESTSTTSLASTDRMPVSMESIKNIKNGMLPAKAFGRGGGTFEILLPLEAPVEVGALVKIPSILPTPIGKVESVDTDEARSFKSLFFRFPVSIFNINYVQVVP